MRFKPDGTLVNLVGSEREIEAEIEYMILAERGDGPVIQNLLCRKRRESGKGYYYTNVTWDGKAGQMQAGKWFYGGRSARAVEYVCRWRGRM